MSSAKYLKGLLFSLTFITTLLLISCGKLNKSGSALVESTNAKGRYLYVVTRYAKIQKEANAFSKVIGFVKMKSRVKPLALKGSWIEIETMKKKLKGYIHRDSVMPLRKIKRFLKKQEYRDHLKMESGENVKGFSEVEEISVSTKGFSEAEEISLATKGFSEEEEISTSTKGFSDKDASNNIISYRYDLLNGIIKKGKILNPFIKLRDFREKRYIGEYYHSKARRIQKKRQKRYERRRFNIEQLKYHDGFLPHEEYDLGKDTAAFLLAKYPLYKNQNLIKYLDSLVDTLAMACYRPEVFNGYRVILVDNPKKNALSTPGGFIMLTTGFLKAARNEDDLVAVLAHEVSHIALRHPTKSIAQSYRQELVNHFAQKAQGKRKALLEKRLGKMHERMKKGHGKKMEYEADLNAIDLMMQLGYEPNSLVYMIRSASETDEVHGDPDVRAGNIQKFINLKKRLFGKVNTIPEERTRLFLEIKKNLK